MRKFLSIFYLLLSFIYACEQPLDYELVRQTDSNGYKYESVTGDPMKVRIYSLENGLKVYLSHNPDEPRIQTMIGVKAGSTFDPPETTGLAHYLEHLMFKGTDEIGTIDWQKEKVLLDEISRLYEEHKSATDQASKLTIYKAIDSVSHLAANYAIANEYDKMLTSMGAEGTNAYTSNEQTVYLNNIPANELERWLNLEKERFSQLVLRLFHTELETVYEEFNMSQDNDSWKLFYTLYEELFPDHPYGTQTTIGRGEHLKNPSFINIHDYWKTYYVPNNMAIIMSGDLDYERTIQLIDQTFGQFKSKEVPEFRSPVEEPITSPRSAEVFGPEAEEVQFAYRFNGIKSEDRKYVSLIDMLLNNSVAGLIDLDLVQKQKVLRAGCYPRFMKYYGVHTFYGQPRQGQSLDEVKDLIMGEIEKIKTGEFEDWLIEAVVNDLKLSEIKSMESNNRVSTMLNAFIYDLNWQDELTYLDDLAKVDKASLVKFAQENYGDNYVEVYKRNGKDDQVMKVEKPPITQVNMNRDTSSVFFRQFEKAEAERLEPVFVDFEEDIQKQKMSDGIEFFYVPNPLNKMFTMYLMVDMGKNHNKKLPLAFELLPYLGTEQYTPEELKQQFYRLGVSFSASSGNDNCHLIIQGLEENFEEGLKLMEHVLTSVKPDQQVYQEFVDGLLKKREDAKKDKWNILWDGMMNYGKYGSKSAFTNIYSAEELRQINPAELTDLVKTLASYPHKIVYYGQQDQDRVAKQVASIHPVSENYELIPAPEKYEEWEMDKNRVFFVDYDMLQSMVLMLSRDQLYSPELMPQIELFGQYFGQGMASIVFQEIRESKGLAYMAFAGFQTPQFPDRSHYLYAVLSTQTDKLKDATFAMNTLLNQMPRANEQFEGAREAVMRQLETERISKMNLFWHYNWHERMGLKEDRRKAVYEAMKTMDIDQLEDFFNAHVKGKNFHYMILGKKEDLDLDVLASLGEYQELTLEEVFNY